MKKIHCVLCNRKLKCPPYVCSKCVVKEENRKAFGIRTSSDYSLEKDDFLLNALSFIHACNALEEFIDKVESEMGEIMMNVSSYSGCNPESYLEDSILQKYDFYSEANRLYKPKFPFSLKTPNRK